MNAFAVLGVDPDATEAEIRIAFRRRAHALHPDKHLAADGRVEPAAHAAFCELQQAYEAALAHARARLAGSSRRRSGLVPQQRRSVDGAPQDTRRRSFPQEQPTTVHWADLAEIASAAATSRTLQDDPVLTLLTLPLDAGSGWSSDELTYWVLTLIPAARPHLAEARRIADAAGPITGSDVLHTTVHVLLTLTLVQRGAQHRVGADRVASLYTLLEHRLPVTVRQGLPGRAHFDPRSTSWF